MANDKLPDTRLNLKYKDATDGAMEEKELPFRVLVPGDYSAWLRVENHCVGCTRVLLEVVPPAASVDDPQQQPSTTWGLVGCCAP